MRLLIAGGGTGGHLFPALAVAKALQAEAPGSSILFVGAAQGIEAQILPNTDFPVRFISARGMRRTGLANIARAAIELPIGIMQSFSIIREFRPDVILGVGGYASGPTLAVAVMLRVATAIQEQNSVMGTTNRILYRFVDRIFTSWEETDPAPPSEKTILAGNPVREDLFEAAEVDKTGETFNVLIFGGSGGARSINVAMTADLSLLGPLARRIRVIHQVGAAGIDEIKRAYTDAGIEADVREFIYEMGSAYRWADLVVSRSGASTLAEITALGKPAIVTPYPYAIGDHQARNARVLESRGAVRVIRDQDLKNGALISEIRNLAENPAILKNMAENSRRLGRPDAARIIALELLNMKRGRS